MDEHREEIERLDASADALGESAAQAAAMVGSFDGELQKMRAALQATGADVATLEKGLSRGLRRAFDGVIFGGDSLSDALKNVATSLANTAYSAAVRPVTNHFAEMLAGGVSNLVGGLFGFADGAAMGQGRVLPFADGAPFVQGKVMPFASGGVVSQATLFPMRGATGLMGEAGPEAIMPLARGPDGKLGVQASGAGRGGTTVVMNISTPDAASFRRSQSQIAAQMSRALGRGDRNR